MEYRYMLIDSVSMTIIQLIYFILFSTIANYSDMETKIFCKKQTDNITFY